MYVERLRVVWTRSRYDSSMDPQQIACRASVELQAGTHINELSVMYISGIQMVLYVLRVLQPAVTLGAHARRWGCRTRKVDVAPEVRTWAESARLKDSRL
jgi:hypothetical protein